MHYFHVKVLHIRYYFYSVRSSPCLNLESEKFCNTLLTVIRMSFLKVVFSGWGGAIWPPPFIFQEELILYNC